MNNGLDMQIKNCFACLLEMEKNMSNNYSIAMNEASSDDLYEDFFDMFTNIKDMARDIYYFMSERGWYPTEFVKEEKVSQTLDELSTKLEQLEKEK